MKEIPMNVRQFLAKQVTATIEAAVAEYDRCLRKHWLVATKVADLPWTKLRVGEVVGTIGGGSFRKLLTEVSRPILARPSCSAVTSLLP